MKKGYTLIELLVVIAIIGILSSIVMVSFSSVRAKSRDNQRITDIKKIQLALLQYYEANRNFGYPNSLNDLTTGHFLSSVPSDPSGGVYHYYAIQSTLFNGSYHLGASLETKSSVLFDAAASTAGFGQGSTSTPCAIGDVGSFCFDVIGR